MGEVVGRRPLELRTASGESVSSCAACVNLCGASNEVASSCVACLMLAAATDRQHLVINVKCPGLSVTCGLFLSHSCA